MIQLLWICRDSNFGQLVILEGFYITSIVAITSTHITTK